MASSSKQPLLFPPVDPFSAKRPSASLPHPKTQKADLCRLWTELCMRESQARIRNQQLLQDFAELEANLALLVAKTDALRRGKRDYEEFLQRLRGDLPVPEHQGASRRQGLVSDKPSKLLARPRSAEWDGQLPLETKYQSVPLPFSPFDTAPAHVSGSHERLGPKFWEYKQSKAPLAHPFYSPTVHPARKHDGPALPSLWSPQRLQKDEKAWLFPGQERGHFPPSPPWTVPGRTTVSGRGLLLPEEWLGPVMAQGPGVQTTGSPTASNILQGKKARGHPILNRGGSAEEHREMAMKKEGHHLSCDPAGLSYHLRLHGEASSCVDENHLGLPLMGSGNDSSGASVSSSAEVNSGQEVAKRNTKRLPRQQRMKAKQEDADTTMESVHKSWERFPGLLEHEETAIIQGSRKLLREETPPCWKEQGNGELGEKGESKEETSVDEGGEATGSLGLGLEQTAEECRPLTEAGAQEDEEIREEAGGQEQEQKVGEVGTAGESNSLGCFDQGLKGLDEDSQTNLGPESQEGERKQQWSNGEGEKNDHEAEGQSGEKTSKPCRSEESQHGVSGDREGDLEWADGSQEGPIHPQKEEEAASTGSSSDEVIIGSQMCVMSKWDNSGDCLNSSLQNEGPVATGAESIGEDEDEEDDNNEEEEDDNNEEEDDNEEEEDDDEEEEIEGNEDEEEVDEEEKREADIEATLAPHSNKPEATRDQQGETVIPDFQELETDPEEANKDGDLHDKDDFYD